MSAKLAMVLILFTGMAAGQSKPADGTVLMEASLSVAKKVCAVRPEADVWIFTPPAWHLLPCVSLRDAFAADSKNAFDDIIPFMQDVDDKRAAAPVTKGKR